MSRLKHAGCTRIPSLLSLERKVTEMESKICSSSFNYLLKEYHEEKTELGQIYDYITEGIILHSRSTWYEKGEKSTKYFLTLEKCQSQKHL